MKKTSKKVTLQTLDEKLDVIGQNLETLTETVDGLAISTKKGFDEVKGEMHEFKDEMTNFKKNTERTFFNLDSHARTTNERLDAIEKALPPLGSLSEALKREVLQLNVRVGRIEAKVGIKTS